MSVCTEELRHANGMADRHPRSKGSCVERHLLLADSMEENFRAI